jgi:hypothetical protein
VNALQGPLPTRSRRRPQAAKHVIPQNQPLGTPLATSAIRPKTARLVEHPQPLQQVDAVLHRRLVHLIDAYAMRGQPGSAVLPPLVCP